MRISISLSAIVPYFFIGLFILIALQFAFITPIFEAPDEPLHYSFASWLADGNGLPNQLSEDTHATGAEQEGSQPPLFYFVSAFFIQSFDRTELPTLRQTNPSASLGLPYALINKNYTLQHEPYPPDISGSRTGVYIVRMLNIFFGAIAIYGVWQTARSISPDNQSIVLLATGLAAFNPQFAFISGAVNNDILMAALGSLITWQSAVMLQSGFSHKRSLILAILVALGTLTKISGLGFGLIVGIAAVLRLRKDHNWRGFFTLAIAGITLWAVLAGWWYLRNLQLYHDFTGTSTMIQWVGQRNHVPLSHLIVELSSLSISYWALFGWFNILAAPWFYIFIDLTLIIGGLGIVYGLWRQIRASQNVDRWLWLLGIILIALAALIVWTLTTHGTQGRLIFPYIAAISLLLALGLRSLAIPTALVLIPLALFSLTAPLTISMPAYTPPAPVSTLPESATPVSLSWGGQIMLVGYEYVADVYAQGDFVPITLYWQPAKASEEDYSIFIHVIGPNHTILGQVDTFPAGGLRRTTQWEAGIIYPDMYQVEIQRPPEPDTTLQLSVGWYNKYNGARFMLDSPASDGSTDALNISSGRSTP